MSPACEVVSKVKNKNRVVLLVQLLNNVNKKGLYVHTSIRQNSKTYENLIHVHISELANYPSSNISRTIKYEVSTLMGHKYQIHRNKKKLRDEAKKEREIWNTETHRCKNIY